MPSSNAQVIRFAAGSARELAAREARTLGYRALLPLLGVYVLVWEVLRPGPAPVGDEGPLLSAAGRLVDGHYAVKSAMNGTEFLWHGPGLPALLGPFVQLRIPLTDIRLLGPLLLFASTLAFYRLLRIRLPRRAALLGAYALGLYAPAWETLGSLHKEPLALLLVIVAMDAGVRYARGGRRRHLAIAGLALGGLVMTRLEYGWVITALLVAAIPWWLRERHMRRSDKRARTAGRWARVALAGCAACVPWLVYTYHLTGHLFYWGNSGGLSLYWMAKSGPGQLGQWHAVHTVFQDPRLALYRPFFDYLGTLHPLQADLALRHAALTAVLAHPAAYLLNVLANVGRMLVGMPFTFQLPVILIVGLIVFNASLLGAFFAAARKVMRAGRSLPAEAAPFLLFAALGFVLHLIPSAEPRMLVPIIPVLVWMIAHTWARPSTALAAS